MSSAKTLTYAGLFLLVGCAKAPQVATEIPQINTYDLGMRYAREFTLSDGTRCVAIMDTGITCEWSKANVER